MLSALSVVCFSGLAVLSVASALGSLAQSPQRLLLLRGAEGLGFLLVALPAPGPWLVSMTFMVYSSQWLSVVGFLPYIYTQAGLSGGLLGILTALAAAVNIVGNTAAGRLLKVATFPRLWAGCSNGPQ